MNRKRPTITDVAKLAQVSIGTVSNVLNGSIHVSEARRERVLAAVRELGYSQNMLARGLRAQRSPVVGVCVPHTSVPYMAALVDAFEEVAAGSGIELMQVLSRRDPEQERQRVASLLRYPVGGLLLVPTAYPAPTYQLIAETGTPVVVVDRPVEGFSFDEVTFDNIAAMREAARRLIALGHRRILLVARRQPMIITRQRLQGLTAALHEAGGPDPSLVECGDDERLMTARIATALASDARPSAIIASSSGVAAWTLRSLQTLKVRCPEDVSLLAFDEPEWADLVTPQLSVVRRPTREIARMSWQLLMQRMRNEIPGVQRVELKAELVLRDSVRPYTG